jgi:hypothetical protein
MKKKAYTMKRKKNKALLNLLLLVITACWISSCSSPESDGKKAAEKKCDCIDNYAGNQSRSYTTFIDKFDSYSFETRVEARQKLDEALQKAKDEFDKCNQQAEAYYYKIGSKHLTNRKNSEKFQFAYAAANKAFNAAKVDVQAFRENADAAIRTIIPPQPDAGKIKSDLKGHTIIEPTRELYRSKFEVQSANNIQNIQVLETQKNGDEIIYTVHLDLNGDVNKYFADINITYYLGDNDVWTIRHIESKQLDILPTGKYDICISAQLVESSWGGINTIQFTNNCDIALLTEGRAFYNNEWHYFAALIESNDSREAAGFADVKDFKIQRVERP